MASIKKKLKGQSHINNKTTPKPVIKYEVMAATGKKVQDPEGNFIINSDSDIEILPSFHDALWLKETHLVYPAQGAKITLGPQNPHVQRVARNAT
jgi:DNA modification methylase